MIAVKLSSTIVLEFGLRSHCELIAKTLSDLGRS